MRMRYRWALVALALVVGLAVIAGFAITRDDDEIQFQTSEVTSGPIVRRALVSGTLEPARMVEVGSQISGTIAAIEVDFNSTVKAGQILARLDPASFQARLTEAEAGLAKSRADRAERQAILDDARRKLESAQTLAGDEQLARAELDLARTTMLQAEADARGADAGIRAAQAGVAEARVSLEHTVIRSPIDGVVIGRQVDVGQTIAARMNAPVLFTLGDLRRMRLLADVPEGDVGGVRQGSDVRFVIESIGDRPFTGTVAEVRLAPALTQAASTSGAGSTPTPTPTPTATTGTSTSGTSTSGTSTSGTSASGTSASGTATSGTGTGSPASTSSTPAAAASTSSAVSRSTSAQSATVQGVVSYIAVIDVDTANQNVPPGGTAIVTLTAGQRPQAVRIPNNALVFAPSAEVLAEVGQTPPVLEPPGEAAKERATRRGRVWKFENKRFVPIAVEVGIADDTWTELVSGDVHPGDQLITAAAVQKR
jgi:RND family efflux transporter MFP subunit